MNLISSLGSFVSKISNALYIQRIRFFMSTAKVATQLKEMEPEAAAAILAVMPDDATRARILGEMGARAAMGILNASDTRGKGVFNAAAKAAILAQMANDKLRADILRAMIVLGKVAEGAAILVLMETNAAVAILNATAAGGEEVFNTAEKARILRGMVANNAAAAAGILWEMSSNTASVAAAILNAGGGELNAAGKAMILAQMANDKLRADILAAMVELGKVAEGVAILTSGAIGDDAARARILLEMNPKKVAAILVPMETNAAVAILNATAAGGGERVFNAAGKAIILRGMVVNNAAVAADLLWKMSSNTASVAAAILNAEGGELDAAGKAGILAEMNAGRAAAILNATAAGGVEGVFDAAGKAIILRGMVANNAAVSAARILTAMGNSKLKAGILAAMPDDSARAAILAEIDAGSAAAILAKGEISSGGLAEKVSARAAILSAMAADATGATRAAAILSVGAIGNIAVRAAILAQMNAGRAAAILATMNSWRAAAILTSGAIGNIAVRAGILAEMNAGRAAEILSKKTIGDDSARAGILAEMDAGRAADILNATAAGGGEVFNAADKARILSAIITNAGVDNDVVARGRVAAILSAMAASPAGATRAAEILSEGVIGNNAARARILSAIITNAGIDNAAVTAARGRVAEILSAMDVGRAAEILSKKAISSGNTAAKVSARAAILSAMAADATGATRAAEILSEGVIGNNAARARILSAIITNAGIDNAAVTAARGRVAEILSAMDVGRAAEILSKKAISSGNQAAKVSARAAILSAMAASPAGATRAAEILSEGVIGNNAARARILAEMDAGRAAEILNATAAGGGEVFNAADKARILSAIITNAGVDNAARGRVAAILSEIPMQSIGNILLVMETNAAVNILNATVAVGAEEVAVFNAADKARILSAIITNAGNAGVVAAKGKVAAILNAMASDATGVTRAAAILSEMALNNAGLAALLSEMDTYIANAILRAIIMNVGDNAAAVDAAKANVVAIEQEMKRIEQERAGILGLMSETSIEVILGPAATAVFLSSIFTVFAEKVSKSFFYDDGTSFSAFISFILATSQGFLSLPTELRGGIFIVSFAAFSFRHELENIQIPTNALINTLINTSTVGISATIAAIGGGYYYKHRNEYGNKIVSAFEGMFNMGWSFAATFAAHLYSQYAIRSFSAGAGISGVTIPLSIALAGMSYKILGQYIKNQEAQLQEAQPAAQPQEAQPAAQLQEAQLQEAQPAAQPQEAQLQEAQPAAQPQEAQPAAQPQEAQPAAQPQEAQPAAQPQEAQPVAQLQEAQPAAQPQEAQPVAQSSYSSVNNQVSRLFGGLVVGVGTYYLATSCLPLMYMNLIAPNTNDIVQKIGITAIESIIEGSLYFGIRDFLTQGSAIFENGAILTSMLKGSTRAMVYRAPVQRRDEIENLVGLLKGQLGEMLGQLGKKLNHYCPVVTEQLSTPYSWTHVIFAENVNTILPILISLGNIVLGVVVQGAFAALGVVQAAPAALEWVEIASAAALEYMKECVAEVITRGVEFRENELLL